MKKSSIGLLVIGSAIVWAAVLIGCAYKLRGTGCYDQISNILIGGVITHLIIIWGPVFAILARENKASDKTAGS